MKKGETSWASRTCAEIVSGRYLVCRRPHGEEAVDDDYAGVKDFCHLFMSRILRALVSSSWNGGDLVLFICVGGNAWYEEESFLDGYGSFNYRLPLLADALGEKKAVRRQVKKDGF